MKLRTTHFLSLLISIHLVFILVLSVLNPSVVHAAVQNDAPKAKISFTFDDGFEDTYTKAAPILAQYGMTGTAYITTGCVGMKTEPNTCPADNDAKYMSWSEVQALQNTYGWEVGSHTVSHPLLASADASIGQPNVLTQAQVVTQLSQSKQALVSHGIHTTSFSSPYGDYSPATLSEIAKYYTNHRGYWDTGYNSWPYNEYLIRNQKIEKNISVATVKGYIDYAINTNQWLVLTFHEIVDNIRTENDNYAYSTANLAEIAAYVASKNVEVANMSETLTSGDNNLLVNGNFEAGLGAGWSTRNPSKVYADLYNNGNYPTTTTSIKFSPSSNNEYLFSPTIPVVYGGNYLIKSYLRIDAIASGEIGYYIDEYDAQGNWISGQWKKAENTIFSQNINFTYTPSSSNVKQASLQIYNTANSGATAYIDTVEWLTIQEPIPDPVVDPPQITNLITNGTFENGLTGWSTNYPSGITIDTNNNGSDTNPQSSVKLTNTSTNNRHLFSNSVAVSRSNSYTISSYLKISQLQNGEIGYYIDEYDAQGNWISGQWKGGFTTTGTRLKEIAYTPSSSNVATASLQIIITGSNSNIIAYFDNAVWVKN